MISIIQQQEIKSFLQKRNLSPVISNEIYDHFIVQISELMKNNLSFQEAFLKTKLDWQSELEMVKADLFSFKKIAKIEKTVLQSRFRNIILSSTVFTMFGFAVLFFLNDYFYLMQIGLLVTLVCLLLYNFIFKKMKFREYYELSFHPLILRNLILGSVLFFGVGYFTQSMNFWEVGINKIFLIYAIAVQIQLLYFRTKKVNVLL
ncbi:MAG: hypothetical protein K0R77_2276 [Chryseobacterium sp.]|jgi:hypothetical protein|uniref:hypothetical protein n=1 Tax=Chryseobacterium sp. TaxID=1871047 RepID=UPI00261F2AEB|nr:hypothetical protein [Chryseobacterium sp.]MDF2553001.1 hypothetical protein [Chryseobacterium sp.]